MAVAVVVGLLVAAGWTAWQAWEIQSDLGRAQRSVGVLRIAVDRGDVATQQVALADLRDSATAADDRAGGWWWTGITHLPVVGDDAEGVQVLGQTLSLISEDGLSPLADVVNQFDEVTRGKGIDLDVVRQMEDPIAAADGAFSTAVNDLDGLDSSGYVGALRTRFDDYRSQVDAAAAGLSAGRTAVDLLPSMAGGDETRDYLLIFQNNAEIRASGGLPGSWARLRAEDGRLTLREQGAWGDFAVTDEPVVPLTAAEESIFGDSIATFFSNPGYVPDFPRSAQIWDGFWARKYPEIDLDGVITIDPVALSYLVAGTGPVQVDDVRLTEDNLVDEVLRAPYARLAAPADQDAFFQSTARAVFDAITGDLASPTAFVDGLARASREGRFLVAPFEQREAEALEGTAVAGALTGADVRTPYVDVGINDATASKMSYYLRYDAQVDSISCDAAGRQQLAGRMTMRQDISPRAAMALSDYVTGGGRLGTEPGSQLLAVQLYGPVGGDIGSVQLNGRQVAGLTVARLEDRPVVSLSVLLNSRDDVVVTWDMTSGDGQSGDPELSMTPSVVPGIEGATSPSGC